MHRFRIEQVEKSVIEVRYSVRFWMPNCEAKYTPRERSRADPLVRNDLTQPNTWAEEWKKGEQTPDRQPPGVSYCPGFGSKMKTGASLSCTPRALHGFQQRFIPKKMMPKLADAKNMEQSESLFPTHLRPRPRTLDILPRGLTPAVGTTVTVPSQPHIVLPTHFSRA